MDQGKELIRLALFGWPLKTSLSPQIHRQFAQQFGLRIEFQPIESQQQDFAAALTDFQRSGGIGCNVTLPLKGEAWRLASDASPQVSQAQAANTLVWQSGGWYAHNTDGLGLMADLTVNHGIEIAGRRLLILGAGGAAAGIFGSLQAAGPAEIMLVNRNLERAAALAERFSATGKTTVSNWEDLPARGRFDLVINATSLGHHGEAPPMDESLFTTDALCYDLNYYKASLALKDRCQQLGVRYIDGLGMLVEQAAKSFDIWTGKQPDSRAVIEFCRKDVA